MIFSKISTKKQKKLPFLLRWWRKKPIHRNNKAEVGAWESNNQKENPTTFDVDTAGQLETSLSNAKVIGGELPGGVLKHLFKHPEWSGLDGLNEYDEDYTSFTPRGAILTQDMIREHLRDGNQIIDETDQNAPSSSANERALRGSEGESEDDLRISSDDPSVRPDADKSPHDPS